MSKVSQRRLWRLAVALIGGAIAVLTYWRPVSRETAPVTVSAPPRPTVRPERAEALRSAPARPPVPVPVSVRARSDESRPAPAAVRTVFPNIGQRVSRWRDFQPEEITVAPQPGLEVTFRRTALRQDDGYVTWVGRNAGLPGASFVGVATEAGYDAVVLLPFAGHFSLHVREDQVVVEEANPADETCGNFPVAAREGANLTEAAALLGIAYAPGFVPGPDSHAETAAHKVDVLVAYDADTLALAASKSSDPVGYIDGQAKAMIESCNLTLAQSGVTAFAWRYLGVVAAPAFTRTGKSLDDLQALAQGGALGSWAAETRFRTGADQLLLFIGGESDFGGRAYTAKGEAVSMARGLAVLRWGYSYLLMAHELAHNFGCSHDRAHVEVFAPREYGAPAPDNDGYWNYGQLWDNPVSGGGTAGTIMSYADWTIPYFSTPNLSVQVTGAQFGWAWNPDLGTHQIGRPETDPKAAYNVRVLNEQAAKLSGFRDEIVMPSIQESPADVSVVRGQSFNLVVRAAGGGLAYRWFKNGVELAGIGGPSYLKWAEDADAGRYHVEVSNRLGFAISAFAQVTVTAPAAPPPAPIAGSGGGGGAPSGWFLGWLGVLVATRVLAARRRKH